MIAERLGHTVIHMDLQPSDVLFIAFVLWLAWEAISGGGGGGKRSRTLVPVAA